jgi:hypothetical protein
MKCEQKIAKRPEELYAELKNFLRVISLGESKTYRRYKLAKEAGRNPFLVKCSERYLWGKFYGGLEWNPGAEPRVPNREGTGYVLGVAPTLEQFCHWYGISPSEGLEGSQ